MKNLKVLFEVPKHRIYGRIRVLLFASLLYEIDEQHNELCRPETAQYIVDCLLSHCY